MNSSHAATAAKSGWYQVVKRLVDLLASAVLLVVFSPLIAVLAIVVKLDSAGPAVFSQERAGLLGRLFRLYKMRTMTDARDSEGHLLPDAERLTKVGRFIRSTSLDELPQLVNVIKGDMSLVGPRPLLPEYLERYSPRQARRHEVRPGITGWAQVNGRNAITWEEKFDLDVWYVDNASLLLDLRIVLMTLARTVSREGICGDGEATARPFTGSADEGGHA